jgi:hypothetical protein
VVLRMCDFFPQIAVPDSRRKWANLDWPTRCIKVKL